MPEKRELQIVMVNVKHNRETVNGYFLLVQKIHYATRISDAHHITEPTPTHQAPPFFTAITDPYAPLTPPPQTG